MAHAEQLQINSPLTSQPTSHQVSPTGDLEKIQIEVARYNLQLLTHPLAEVLKNPPLDLLKEYASIQYVDSVLWVPMLALMKDRVKNPRLKKALTDNLLCEAGANHTSHITLCKNFIESLGISPQFGDFRRYSEIASHPIEIMNSVSGLSEAEIAGWILVSEAVVPSLFSIALSGFEQYIGVDTTYLTEHIHIDADEHAQWMLDSVGELLDEGVSVKNILHGVHIGGRTALSVPDALYAKFKRGGYRTSLPGHILDRVKNVKSHSRK
jgi:pyrroloquinoline quinone (PQQ) biosynthesis protein C